MALDDLNAIADEALLALYAKGDAAAARVLTHRLTPRVFAHAYRLLADQGEAEDVAQEALLRLWKQAPDWRQGEAKVTTWLFRVVANLCFDRKRSRRSRGVQVPIDEVPEPADPHEGAADALQQRSRLMALEAALIALPERQRQAVVLRHIEGLGNAEIGEIMGVGTEAVESLTARGKRALGKILSGKREELGFSDE